MNNLHDLIHSCDVREDLCERVTSLKDENARLRKVARRMWPIVRAHCDLLLLLGYNDSESYDIFVELHELGVKVDS